MPRHKDINWNFRSDAPAEMNADSKQLALLMDLRDELKALNAEMVQLNRLLHCPNFVDIPRTLRSISRKIPTRQPRRRA